MESILESILELERISRLYSVLGDNMQSLNDIIKTMVDRGDDVVTGIGNAFQSLSDIIKNVDTVYHGVTLVVLSHDKRMQIEDSHQHSDLHATKFLILSKRSRHST